MQARRCLSLKTNANALFPELILLLPMFKFAQQTGIGVIMFSAL
jgi:hypothetical protein